jgi:hypothetical protein
MRSMTQTLGPVSTVSDRQAATTNAAGAPVQRSMRGILRQGVEEEAEEIRLALNRDLDSTGYSDRQIEEKQGTGAAQLSRIRNGQAHAPWDLVVWTIENTRLQPPAVLVALCRAGEGEFKPKPPPSVEERHAATLDVLHEMGISEVVVSKVARKLGVTR